MVSAGGRLVKELEAIGAHHYELPVGKKSLLTAFRMVGELRDIIRKEDIDIVHARSRVPGVIAYAACRITNRIFITTAHGYYSKSIMSMVMSWGRYVIVASNVMAKYMMKDFRIPYDRIRLIPRGVDLARFKFKPKTKTKDSGFTIGMVSRITPLKGHADFIKAIAIVAREIPQLKVMIAGSAPKDKYREDLELMVRGLGLSSIVEFTGAVSDVPAFMGQLNLLVSATVTPEAFGRVIIEAHAVGVPVVATKVGGVVDIVEDGVTGLLCLPANSKDMASKIMRIYRDKELAQTLVSESRRRVELNYNVDVMMERTLSVYRESMDKKNILVIKLSAIGDVILSIPSLKSIRARYPGANIKVLVGIEAREVLDKCPYINDVIVADFKNKHKGIAGLWRLGRELREHCFDIAIDLQNNRKSHLLAYLSLASLRYGYDNGKWSALLNRKQKDDAPYLDPLDHQFRTLRLAGIKPVDKVLEIWPSEYDMAKIEKFLSDSWIKPSQPVVGIAVRASERWFSKNWPPSYIAQLCDKLAKELNIRVILAGSKNDSVVAGYICKMTKSKPVVAVGKTDIQELAALMKRFCVFITPDSAPMHIASAMKTPVIALFGPTDPARHLVPSNGCVVLCKAGEVKCKPCYKTTCQRKTSCMRMITVDEVFELVKKNIKAGYESALRIDAF